MSLLNRDKIRPDVLEILDEGQKILIQATPEFLKQEENKNVNLQALFMKVLEENKKLITRAANQEGFLESMYEMLSKEEMLFVAKFLRFTSDFTADVRLKEAPIPEDVKIEIIDAGGVPAEWQIVPGAIEERVLLYFHGSAMVIMSPKTHRRLTVEIAKATNMRVLSVDYRLAPEHPFPAGLEDCTTAYKWLLSTGIKSENIIIAGDSAGGNLTLASLLKLKDEGISLPAAAITLSPGTDYTEESKTFYENAETDALASGGIFWCIPAYLAGKEPYNPLISPLFGNLKDLPPLLIQVSKSEVLYDHSTRLYERAKAVNINVILQEWDDMPHVFHFYFDQLPESRNAIEKIGEFVKEIFKNK
ncbi:MAG: alpha/beta hydrolase [Promethearchaeota archaeon]|jgi:acetyl esterase/lipase